MGYIYKSGVQSGVHVTCKFPPVRVRGGGPPGTDGRPRAGGRLPDGQGGRERATATERNGMKQTKYIHKFSFLNVNRLFPRL